MTWMEFRGAMWGTTVLLVAMAATLWISGWSFWIEHRLEGTSLPPKKYGSTPPFYHFGI
jgi:uncharacterized membrane protein YphA (DoxX/SURF4 family)